MKTYRSAFTRPRDKADQMAERLGRGESLYAVRYRWPKGQGHTVCSGPDEATAVARFAAQHPHVQVELPL